MSLAKSFGCRPWKRIIVACNDTACRRSKREFRSPIDKSMEKIARWILARLEMFFVNSWILGGLPEFFFFCCSYFKAPQSLPPLQACSRTVLMNFWIFSPVTDGRTTALIVMVVVWYTWRGHERRAIEKIVRPFNDTKNTEDYPLFEARVDPVATP